MLSHNSLTKGKLLVVDRLIDWREVVRQQYPKTRMIVVTGQETIPEAIAMYRLGAFDYFTRDFRKSIVSKKIREAIGKPVILALP